MNLKPLYNYGISQEDALTELAALDIQPGDRLLCIASGGEVPLNLLALRDTRIVAADVSANQLALARLKLAACRALEPVDAAAFLGFMEVSTERRRRLFAQVAPLLAEDDRHLWGGNMAAIEEGPIRAGRFEKYFAKFRFAGLAVLKRGHLRDLFELETLEERRDFFDRFLSTPLLKALFSVAFHPLVYRKRGISAQGLIHGGSDHVADFFYGRFKDFCTVTPPRRNYYLQFSFFGRVLFPEALPEYLTDEGARRIRERPDRIAWRLGSFEEVLRAAAIGDFNKFHLSNIGDWMTRIEYAGLLALICDKAAAASRAVVRYIHLDHAVPEGLRGRVTRDERRGEELMRRDRFPFYHLVIMETA
jgi:S-adenosylmethionine:diacylglycerol 3-amino-3-carboxypropyl transferase